MTTKAVTYTITAQNKFTGDVKSGGTPQASTGTAGIRLRNDYNISVSGISGDTVWLQRSFDAGVTWYDIESYTADTQKRGFEPEGDVLYRLGVKTGGYSAGTIIARLSS